MEKLIKKVDQLVGSLKKDQSIVVLCNNDDGESYYAVNASVADVAAHTAHLLDNYLNNGEESVETVSDGIITGICMFIEDASEGALRLERKFMSSGTTALMKQIKKMKLELKDDEDCEHCEEVLTCQLQSAIKFRKKNHIPAPNTRSKGKKESKGN